MKVVSLFAGIGGFDLAFQRAGFEIVAHVEIDEHCQKLLAEKFLKAQTFADVRECGAHNLPACDILTFGFPCQDLSVAGKRAGLDGKRSGLFYEATRIAYELQPAYLIWENVPGLFSSNKGHDFLAVLSEMDRIGYCGAWRVFDAQYFGLAQRRRRVFGVFAREHLGAECCAEILSLAEGVRGHPAPSRETRQEVAGTLGGSSQKGGFRTTDLDNNGAFVCATLTKSTFSGGPSGADKDQQLVCVPTVARSLNAGRDGYNDGSDQTYVCSTVSAKWSKGSSGPAGDECGNLIAFPANLSGTQRAASENLAPNLQAQNPTAVAFEPGSISRHAGPRGEREQCSTLRSQMVDNQPAVRIGSCVRRLTPRECERLQGFPDDWTAEFSDSTRYKMLGNAVAVPVVEWIAKRMYEIAHLQTPA